MKNTSAQIPSDLYERLKEEKENGHFSSLGEAIRHYLRKGMEE